MACPSGKIEHVTRDAALGHVRELEYKNSLRGRIVDSVGLNAWPCRMCDCYHVGRRPIATVYHYTTVSQLVTILEAGTLTPPRPKRLERSKRRQASGALLWLRLCTEEPAPLTWFTWDDAWNRFNIPHPGVFLDEVWATTPYIVTDHGPRGIARIGVPATFVTLRWRDYAERNGQSRLVVGAVAKHLADHANWTATDQPVPTGHMRSIDVWHNGEWVNGGDVEEEVFDRWCG